MPQAGVDAALTEAQDRHAAALELCRERRYTAAEPLAREAWARLQAQTAAPQQYANVRELSEGRWRPWPRDLTRSSGVLS